MKARHLFGQPGSTRRRSWTSISVTALLLLGLNTVGSSPAGAVHDDDFFELDRNAFSEDAVDGEDWDQVCPATTAGCLGGTTASASSFVTEAANATIFTGGGSKDDLDVTQWLHKNGSTPDKDDLAHGYAARYDDHLYFGADRFAATGDATVGVWFFQGTVGPIAGGTFSGAHIDGDILVLSDFTKGGETSTIRVYQWNGPGGTISPDGAINGTLDLLYGTVEAPADCVGPPQVADNDPACATVNQASTASPWAFAPKSGPAGSFPKGHFYEGGIDLGFLDLEDECFASFLVETRSSQSVDATLKDFVGGQFASCSAAMTTTPSAGAGGSVFPGTLVTDTATVTGSGVSDAPTPTGDVTFYVCGPIETGLCDTGGTLVGTGTLAETVPGTAEADSPAFDTSGLAPGRYCFRAEWPGDENYELPLTHAGTGDSECFYIVTLPSSTLTGPVDGSGVSVSSFLLGGTVYDRAVVTGQAAGGDPTGDVNFYVCGPLASPALCTAGGTALPGNPRTLVSDGVDETYTSSATSGAFTPSAPGRYCFRADYGGSDVYDPSSDSAAGECFTVFANTSTATAQDWLPNDTATISATGGVAISGTLTFTLHEGGDCTGTVLYTEPTITLTDEASPAIESTSNTTVTVDSTSTVSWLTVFDSSDDFVNGSSHCESTALTITN
jgi:hypothetical protein